MTSWLRNVFEKSTEMASIANEQFLTQYFLDQLYTLDILTIGALHSGDNFCLITGISKIGNGTLECSSAPTI